MLARLQWSPGFPHRLRGIKRGESAGIDQFILQGSGTFGVTYIYIYIYIKIHNLYIRMIIIIYIYIIYTLYIYLCNIHIRIIHIYICIYIYTYVHKWLISLFQCPCKSWCLKRPCFCLAGGPQKSRRSIIFRVVLTITIELKILLLSIVFIDQ